MGLISHIVKRSDLKIGDHIYAYRKYLTFPHHGIYVGENKVVHFIGNENHVELQLAEEEDDELELSEEHNKFGCALDEVDDDELELPEERKFGWTLKGVDEVNHARTNLCSSSGSSSSIWFSSSASSFVTPPCCLDIQRCGLRKQTSGVILSCLNCFLENGSLHRFEYGVSRLAFTVKFRGGTCTTAKSDPPGAVISRALRFLRDGFGGYNLVKNNCEDFALCCKTGKKGSGQVASIRAASWAAVQSLPLGLFFSNPPAIFAATTAMYLRNWNNAEIAARVFKLEVVPCYDIIFN